jgi:uncharacterized protein
MPEKFIKVQIIPNAKKTTLLEETPDFLKIKLSAPALEGKANNALIEFLSKHYKYPKSLITIIKGQKSRHKTITINL